MKKRKIISFILSLALIVSFMPFFTIQADAFSTGSKTLLKTKTVTIKPGKTYKSPIFKLSKKMAVQVPIKITPSGTIKDSDYEYLLKYTMSLKTSKGKTKDTYKCPAQGIYNVYTDELLYDDWIYFYNSLSKPGFSKGKYIITIKNTTKRSIKVKYSIKGYTKFATKAELSNNLTADYSEDFLNAGRIGPGLPVIKSITSSNPDVGIEWGITHNGKLTLIPYNYTHEECSTVVTIKLLKGTKKYKVKIKMKAEPGEAEEEEETAEIEE